MRQFGYLYTCDRCGEKEFIEDKCTNLTTSPFGWKMIFKRPADDECKNLCPKCYREWESTVDAYFQIGKIKEL